MRPSLLHPPGPQELEDRSVHEVVRDFPELIPFLRDKGVSLKGDGARSLAEVRAEGHGPGDLSSVLAWRDRAAALH